MAKFSFDGIDTISASLDQLARLTDEEKFSVIQPAADLLKGAYVNKLQAEFLQHSGALSRSVSYVRQKIEDGVAMHLFLKGKHPGSGTGKRNRRKGRTGSNGKYSGTNAEVGYILEHGSPRIAATHWMENTNEEQADAILASQEEQWDALLKTKGL